MSTVSDAPPQATASVDTGSTTPSPGEAAASVWVHLAALLGYFAMSVLVTYPAVVQFTTQVPGDLIADRDQNLWNL
ncbi:MAG: hypothetical protein M3328_06075, partial [Chloroflexota bacterium]|nr:hypothetical protein [Chloroflexota bacterium]